MAQPADVPSTRYVLDNATVRKRLGPLRALSGTWEGRGFNLIARPDFRDKANLYLQLNQTHETLTITPIGSAVALMNPKNRGWELPIGKGRMCSRTNARVSSIGVW